MMATRSNLASVAAREPISSELYVTANAYTLCADHLAAWRAGGNNVAAYPFDPADPDQSPECVDCNPLCGACGMFYGPHDCDLDDTHDTYPWVDDDDTWRVHQVAYSTDPTDGSALQAWQCVCGVGSHGSYSNFARVFATAHLAGVLS